MVDQVNFMIYPEVDENGMFSPEVRQALADTDEFKSILKDSKNRRLDSFEVQGSRASTVATRIFGGRMGTFDNTTAKTFQVTTELAQHFDAVRVLFANTDMTFSHAMRLVGVSAASSKADLNNSSGTFVTGTRNAMQRIYAELAPGSGRMAFTASDWIPVSSVPRTDGGTKPLLVARVYMNISATLPVYGNGTDDFTNWATRTDGRIWAARHQDGLAVTSGFTNTTNRSQSPIVGFQYLARGKVVTVAASGDSITDGRGTYLGEGFVMPALEQLSNINDVAYEYMNIGWSGQATVTFAERAIDVLQSEFKPDVLVFPSGSPNDVNPPITQTHIDNDRYNRNRVTAEAGRQGVPIVLWTWLPTNTAVKNYGASDSLRTAYNTELVAQAGRGIFVADLSTAISGVTSSGQVQMLAGSTSDDIHPNDTGNGLLRDVLKPVLAKAAISVNGNASKALIQKTDLPTYQITDADAHVSKMGAWVYAGSGAANWSIAPATQVARGGGASWYWIKNRSAVPLTLTRTNADVFALGGASVTSFILQPGQACLLTPGSSNAYDVHGYTPSNVQTVLTSNAATLTLARDNMVYVNTGAATTWTLPALANNLGLTYRIKNRGSGAITLQRAGADQLYDTAAQTSISIAAGASATIINDGTYWLSL